MSDRRSRRIAIMGATATGKSSLAIAIAEGLGGEVVSMDSRQVYRRLDIGTGKVTAAERARVPHHLIDILDAHETPSAGQHAGMARAAQRDIDARGRLTILAGGTGLYYRALSEPFLDIRIPADALNEIRASFTGIATDRLYQELTLSDPSRAADVGPGDRVRITRALELIRWTGEAVTSLYATRSRPAPDIDECCIVLTMPRYRLRGAIAERTRELYRLGWVDEVRDLLATGVTRDTPAMQSLGYSEIAASLTAGRDGADTLDAVITRTQQYARRQETFFRGMATALRVDASEPGWVSAVLESVRRWQQADGS